MALYRIHFRWKEKDVTLRARGLDLTHPYFVSITELQFAAGNTRIIDPSEDELRRDFGNAKNVMIPIAGVSLIEELGEEQPVTGDKIKPFTVVDPEKDEDGDENGEDPEESDEQSNGLDDDTPPTLPHRDE